MRRINLIDSGMLMMEKREAPVHVAGLSLYSLPKGVNEQEFLREISAVMRTPCEYRKPFGEFVRSGLAGSLGPMYWEEDKEMDLDYHVRHSALPNPGRYRELFALVSRLHSTLMDRSRPLWETHIIEGLPDRQFAVYQKMHHATIDGVGAMHLVQSMSSEDPNKKLLTSPLSQEVYEDYKSHKFGDIKKPEKQPSIRELTNVAEYIKEQYDTAFNVAGALRQFGGALFGLGGDLTVPWQNVPQTLINTELSVGRRFVAQSWSLERIKRIARAIDGTVNDVVLAMCAGALRRYLLDLNSLPSQSLKAMTPVSLREKGDLESSNAIGFLTADLGTNISDPEKRIRTIQRSMQAGKDMMRGMTTREINLFMQIAQMPSMMAVMLGMGIKYPPYSTVISNVPGPKEQLYFNGASLDGLYPASVLLEGMALNISLVGYNGRLDFGITACRRSMPQVQRLIDHLEEALVELEDVIGIKPAAAKSKSKPKTKASPKSTVKADNVKAEPRLNKSKAKPNTAAKLKKGAAAKPKTKTKPAVKTKAKPAVKAKARAKPKAKAVVKTKGELKTAVKQK